MIKPPYLVLALLLTSCDLELPLNLSGPKSSAVNLENIYYQGIILKSEDTETTFPASASLVHCSFPCPAAPHPLPGFISSVSPQYNSNPRDCANNLFSGKGVWINLSKPTSLWGKHIQHPAPSSAEDNRTSHSRWPKELLAVSKGGRVLGIIPAQTRLCDLRQVC